MLLILLTLMLKQPVQDHAPLFTIETGHLSTAELGAIKCDPELDWWVEVGDRLLVQAHGNEGARTEKNWLVSQKFDGVARHRLRFMAIGCDRAPQVEGMHILVKAGRWAVVVISGSESSQEKPEGHHHGLLPFQPNVTLVKTLKPNRKAAKRGTDLQALVDLVDNDRWYADIVQLAGWNRHTEGSEVHQARDWLVATFQQMDGLTVSTPQFSVGQTPAYNVMAVLEGTTTPDQWYIVGAHYDSTSQNPSQDAPGAEDNASGTAAVLEMARIFSANPPPSTIIFMCYSGEEQGLFGSKDHVADLMAAGDKDKIQAVLTMDMIGYSSDNSLDCLLETRGGVGDALLNPFADAAATYTSLIIHTSLFAFGSDHVPYLNQDIPALLVIEDDWDIYPSYHHTTDTPDNISKAMGGEILKMNVATLAKMMGMAGNQPSFLDYVAGWGFPPVAPLTDPNGNGRIDVLDLISL